VVETPGCQEVDSTTVETTSLNQESIGYKVSYVLAVELSVPHHL
jgi:hypothetical protein